MHTVQLPCLFCRFFLMFGLLSQSSSISGATGFAAGGGGGGVGGKTTPCPVEKGTWLVLYCGGNATIEQVKTMCERHIYYGYLGIVGCSGRAQLTLSKPQSGLGDKTTSNLEYSSILSP